MSGLDAQYQSGKQVEQGVFGQVCAENGARIGHESWGTMRHGAGTPAFDVSWSILARKLLTHLGTMWYLFRDGTSIHLWTNGGATRLGVRGFPRSGVPTMGLSKGVDGKVAMNKVIVRDERIVIKLSAVKKGELQEISEQMGVSISAIGAYVIGQWLMQQQMMTKPLMEKMNALMAETVKELVAQGQGQECERSAT